VGDVIARLAPDLADDGELAASVQDVVRPPRTGARA
jgi:hypothetical protein